MYFTLSESDFHFNCREKVVSAVYLSKSFDEKTKITMFFIFAVVKGKLYLSSSN